MHPNLHSILELVKNCLGLDDLFSPRGGIYTYSQSSMILFFVVMMLKGIHQFKTMEAYAIQHYGSFGWQQAPSRPTIRRRFLVLPAILQKLMEQIAQYCSDLDACFNYCLGFIDKSVFRAKGGLWHKKHMKLGVVPHPSIDQEASWGKSAYHGWRFGYGLHLIVNQLRFPISACVTAASVKDHTQLMRLVKPLAHRLLVIVGDQGYQAIQTIWKIWKEHQVFVLTNVFFQTASKLKNWYNERLTKMDFGWLYAKRKPSVEPAFALIKELFGLQHENQLPYKGIHRVSSYLMICSLTLQLLMVFNHLQEQPIGSLNKFRAIIK